MKIENLKGKRILILGYGKEGRATEKFLKAKVPDSTISIADQSTDVNYLEKQTGYDLVIKTPGIPKKLVTIPYTTATNIFFANVKNKIIGVTGTKGKSTTASLIYEILKAGGLPVHLGGNIGKPILNELLKPVGPEDIFVCELSSYQLDDIKFSPDISVVLDLFPEHMNYHGGVEAYYRAKKNIIRFVNETDYFIYNQKYPELIFWSEETKSKTLPFVNELPFTDKGVLLIGQHNRENIKAAVTVCKLFNISDDLIEKTVKIFEPLPHRLEFVGDYKGIKFYDDAISTTPESTVMAVKSLDNIGTIFLGGQDRGYNFNQLVRIIGEKNIRNFVFFPDTGKKILSLLMQRSSQFNFLESKNMEDAVKWAFKNTSPGSICLLSTASPSYSVWKNFEEKGDLFKTWVKRIGCSL